MTASQRLERFRHLRHLYETRTATLVAQGADDPFDPERRAILDASRVVLHEGLPEPERAWSPEEQRRYRETLSSLLRPMRS